MDEIENKIRKMKLKDTLNLLGEINLSFEFFSAFGYRYHHGLNYGKWWNTFEECKKRAISCYKNNYKEPICVTKRRAISAKAAIANEKLYKDPTYLHLEVEQIFEIESESTHGRTSSNEWDRVF